MAYIVNAQRKSLNARLTGRQKRLEKHENKHRMHAKTYPHEEGTLLMSSEYNRRFIATFLFDSFF